MILAATEAAADAAAPYWSAVLTTIPVLALALVVETGRQLRNSLKAGWIRRGIQTLLLTLYSVALVVAFQIALDALIHRDGLERAQLVSTMLSAAFLLLVGLPLLELVLRANPEVMLIVGRVLPGSRWWRQRRTIRSIRKRTIALRARVDARLALTEAKIERHAEMIEDARTRGRAIWESHLREPDLATDASAEARAERAASEELGRRLEFDRLAPGNYLGAVERDLHLLRENRDEMRELVRHVSFELRRLNILVRGARLFRFASEERKGVQAILRSLDDVSDRLDRS